MPSFDPYPQPSFLHQDPSSPASLSQSSSAHHLLRPSPSYASSLRSTQASLSPTTPHSLSPTTPYSASSFHTSETSPGGFAYPPSTGTEERTSFAKEDAGHLSHKKIHWWDHVIPSSTACRLLLLTIILESVIDLVIEGNILWRFNNEVQSSSSTELELENKRRLPIYLIIYGLAHLWELVLTVIAIRTRNTVQVVAITAFNFAVLGYAVIQIYELRNILGSNLAESLDDTNDPSSTSSSLLSLPLNVLTAVVIGVVATGSLALVMLTYFVRREFGWERYRFLGADLSIRRYYWRFQVFECFCYFSAFFCAGFGIQFIWLVLQKTDVEYIITWVMFPLSILLLVVGQFAAKYENKWFFAPFMTGLVGGCAYFIFKLFRIWQQHDTTYLNVTASLTTFDALSLLSLGACLVWGILVWKDFGKGLREAVLNQPPASPWWRMTSAGPEENLEKSGRPLSLI